MSALSDYLENKLFDHVFRNNPYTPPSTVYAALYTADPTDANTAGTEVSAASYARQPVTFGAPSNGAGSNVGTVTFPVADEAWGTIVAVALMDAPTGGNQLIHATLDVPKQIDINDQFFIRPTTWVVTFA